MKPAVVLLSACCSLLVTACNEQAVKQAEINEPFRKTADTLQKNAGPAAERLHLYKTAETRLNGGEGSSRLQQLRYATTDFYGYIDMLTGRLVQSCLDSNAKEQDNNGAEAVACTNQFFASEKNAAQLLPQLTGLQKQFGFYANSETLQRKIAKLTEYPGKEKGGDFLRGWFYNVPPVAAFTMLRHFENEVQGIEKRILLQLASVQPGRQ